MEPIKAKLSFVWIPSLRKEFETAIIKISTKLVIVIREYIQNYKFKVQIPNDHKPKN